MPAAYELTKGRYRSTATWISHEVDYLIHVVTTVVPRYVLRVPWEVWSRLQICNTCNGLILPRPLFVFLVVRLP